MLKNEYLKNIIKENVNFFKHLFLEWFINEKEDKQINVISRIQNLSQKLRKSLTQYYQRVQDLLIFMRVKNQKKMKVLNVLLQTMLNLIIEHFISRFQDSQLQLWMLKYSINLCQSLKRVYNLTETEMQQMKTEKDLIQHIQKTKELKLLYSIKKIILVRNENINSTVIQFIMSQIHNIKVDENELLN